MPKINQEEYEKIKLLPYYDWNWIAREKTGKILGFTNKPIKTDEVWKDKQTRLWFNYKDSQLFRFIQWEDEEPYEIAELIREYEIKELRLAPSGTVIVDSFDESEETEVLSQEWIDKKRLIERVENYIPLHDKTVGDVMNGILEIIKQLPELEVLSPDWIDENQHPYGGDYHVPSEKLEDVLVPKQELPVVPTWFDEWWRDVNKGEGNLFHNIERFYNELYSSGMREACDYISSPGNKEKLLNIIINELDYEVEEPLYRVSAGSMATGFWFLCKDNDGDITIGTNKDYYEADWDSLKLTEQEIKDFDERYWIFAVKVEEVEK